MADLSFAEDDTATLKGDERKDTAARVLDALKDSARGDVQDWNDTCDTIDEIYSLMGATRNKLFPTAGLSDHYFDLFWASFEILKPATYARPPRPVVAPFFSDNKPIYNVTSELLERTSLSSFSRAGMHDVMNAVRDDLLFAGRGVMWAIYETGGAEGQRVCIEHVDRRDFRHEAARYWTEVGWVAKRSWLSRKQMEARFKGGDWRDQVKFTNARAGNMDAGERERLHFGKCGVWEVWHKADNRVYWVTEGYDDLLDDSAPHLDLAEFWPCPRPAFGTLERRKLVPVPDWQRYATHFQQISELTGRVYSLLRLVRLKGLIAAGGDVGDAVEQLLRSEDDSIFIPVPQAAMQGTGELVTWVPLQQVAEAITGLIGARAQLIQDFYELSGISDIMRGASQAQETLGAQQIKQKNGSIRIQAKVDELQRIAADMVKIQCEIIADKFSQKTLLDISLLEIPTKADIAKQVKAIEDGARQELMAIQQQAQEAVAQDPEAGPQAMQAMEQAQQGVMQKSGPMLAEAESMVPIEDVMKLLRDDRARSFAFEIESDSTILTDELLEKESRAEFLRAFTEGQSMVVGLAQLGEPGVKLAGEVLKFVLAPYRAGRQLQSAIDEFVKQAPAMAGQMAGEDGDAAGLAEANGKLADAEMLKAQAQMARVEATSQNDQAEMQRKMAEMQQKSAKEHADLQERVARYQLDAASNAVKAQEAEAKVDLIRAQTMKALADAGVAVDNQALDEFKSLADIEFKAADVQERQAERELAQVNREVDRADGQMNREQERSDNFRTRDEDREFAMAQREEGQ